MTNLLWLLLGVDRLGVGGGIRAGLRSVCTIIAIIIATCARGWGHPWQFIVADITGLLLLITLPHGPFLSPDSADIKDNRFDPVYILVRWIKNVDARWWTYAILRYPGIAALWSVALWFFGDPIFFAPLAAATWIPSCYRVLWPSRKKLPTFQRAGDEVENWDELVGWTFTGATIALLRYLGGG